jgi:hypothetical protein
MPTDSTVQIVAAGRHSAHRGMMVSFEDLHAQRASDTSKMEIVITAIVNQHLRKRVRPRINSTTYAGTVLTMQAGCWT